MLKQNYDNVWLIVPLDLGEMILWALMYDVEGTEADMKKNSVLQS